MELYHDHMQNYRRYNIPKAQLIIADIPYNIGVDAYASSPQWYKDGDNKNGESELAGKQFFDTDKDFKIAEFMHFASTMLKKEPKETGQAGCMIVFCAFEQMETVSEYGKRYGFNSSFPLFFIKDYSPQVLKANMKIVGATEHAVVLYRKKLPKFNNDGKMIFNWMWWERDTITPKIHPNQKPLPVLKKLINIYTDFGDVVIDPTAGSGVTLLAAEQLGRKSYGFEIKKQFVDDFNNVLAKNIQTTIFQQKYV